MSAWYRVQSVYAELRRRKVVRTGAAYIVAGAATIQVADAVFPALGLPGWSFTALVLLAIAGLPVTVVLAWVYDITRAPDSSVEDEPGEEPPASVRPARRYEIALPVTPLLGREAELEAAARLLTDPASRLLTLTGTGGIGKTRLAHEIAARASTDFAHGACFVSLAGVDTVASLPAALADALELPLAAHEAAAQQLIGFLQEKSLLLVLDNFEHLVEGAPLLADVLAHAPAVRILTTSRRRLRVAGETVLPLEALSVPASGDALEESDAALLFLAVARRNDARFTPTPADADAIARICRVADGIPLAIELAGASVGVLSCAHIAREIEQHHQLLVVARRDLPPRHQNLGAAFESSWRLLDDEEQGAFRRLSVFRSGFEATDAADVAGADLPLLARLVEVSLVRQPIAERFSVLEVLRQFGQEKLALDADEEARVHTQHTRHFIDRLDQLAAVQAGPELAAALDRMADALGDVHAAWQRAITAGAHGELGRGAVGLYRLMEARGRAREGADLFRQAVAAVRPAVRSGADATSTAARAALGRLLTREAACEVDVGRISEAVLLLDEGLMLARAHDDLPEIGFALGIRCAIARATGDYRATVFEESLELQRRIGDTRGIARALNSLGGARQALGEYDGAKRLYRESIGLLRSIELDSEAWPGINNLAGIAQIEGDYSTARRLLEEELQASRKRRNPRALSFLLQNLSYVLYRAGDRAAARPVLLESIALAREMGYRNRLAYSLNTLASLEAESGSAEQADQVYREALNAAVLAQEAPLVTEILVGIARLDIKRGNSRRASAILGMVERHPGCDEETRSGARALHAQMAVEATVNADMSLQEVLAEVLAPQSPGAIPS